MDVGDLVRVCGDGVLSKGELAFVTDIKAAYPSDPHESDRAVTVMFVDGQKQIWYDWQLELVSENG
tara:strand:- start:207 stop:404 length:198 start_codon:yes stop_codon:yes gene_type:complete